MKYSLNDENLHIVEYTKDVPGLMHISSFVVTKPGGLTSSESLTSNLPILITNPIPGQEEENAEFLVNCGAGILLGKNDDIDSVVDGFMDDGKLEEMRFCAKKVAKPGATGDICRILLGD